MILSIAWGSEINYGMSYKRRNMGLLPLYLLYLLSLLNDIWHQPNSLSQGKQARNLRRCALKAGKTSTRKTENLAHLTYLHTEGGIRYNSKLGQLWIVFYRSYPPLIAFSHPFKPLTICKFGWLPTSLFTIQYKWDSLLWNQSAIEAILGQLCLFSTSKIYFAFIHLLYKVCQSKWKKRVDQCQNLCLFDRYLDNS